MASHVRHARLHASAHAAAVGAAAPDRQSVADGRHRAGSAGHLRVGRAGRAPWLAGAGFLFRADRGCGRRLLGRALHPPGDDGAGAHGPPRLPLPRDARARALLGGPHDQGHLERNSLARAVRARHLLSARAGHRRDRIHEPRRGASAHPAAAAHPPEILGAAAHAAALRLPPEMARLLALARGDHGRQREGKSEGPQDFDAKGQTALARQHGPQGRPGRTRGRGAGGCGRGRGRLTGAPACLTGQGDHSRRALRTQQSQQSAPHVASSPCGTRRSIIIPTATFPASGRCRRR